MLKAVALAMREVPAINGYWVGRRAAEPPRVDVGVAIALRGGGLIAPAIHDADQQAPRPADARAARPRRPRAGRRPAVLGADRRDDHRDKPRRWRRRDRFGVIYPPQVALVGFGAVTERRGRARRHGGRPPSCVTATLAADHRATDGHQGSAFLTAIDRLLQTPEQL